ncbi:hypothetical protein FJM67_13290 [Maribrevibacterium harenarium]|uniref:Uncharacterized protein n=1 Tax=Maribrevibacterium harenarium TaxID=2589817 RepID=A0A501WJ35_9GAMM|nr:hypothetical protein [Maribrevibacterium harenarium]TPE48445.1 hypothetical protein FJM67_13290 [Maribrevibacterium harenarium]
MLKALIVFHLQLLLIQIMPSWYQIPLLDETAAHRHAHFRRTTKTYRRKRKLVRNLWTGTGIFMVAFPSPPTLIGALLFSTCLSFAILDESEK